MVATDFEIKFAQSRVDYFEKVLKKGEGDGLKTLLRAIKTEAGTNVPDYSALGIAKAINASKAILQKDKGDAVTKAAQLTKAAAAMKEVTATDIQNAKDAAQKATTAAGNMKEVTATDIQNAKDAAQKATTAAGNMKEVTATDIQNAKDAAQKATTAFNIMKENDIVTQDDMDNAAAVAKIDTTYINTITTKGVALTAKDITDAQAAALKATTAAGNMKEVTATDIQNAKDAAQKDTTAAGNMKEVTATDIQNAKDAAQKDTTAADAIKVGDDPVLTAAKALLGEDTVTKIKADDGKDAAKLTALYTDKAPDFMKNYGFINAILKNIPNAGKDVLKSDAANKIFTIEAAITTQVKLDMFNAYAKIVLTACGADPFVNSNDLPEKDSHSTHVADCLEQANKIAYALLADANCGKDKLDNGSVKADCLKALAGMASDLYNGGDFDDMNIDLSGKYPYEDAIPELTKIDL